MNHDVLIEAGKLAEAGKGFCLVTVTATKGSTPRKAGTMMLVRSDGSTIGTVGGGVTETVAAREALEALRNGKAFMQNYTLDEDPDGKSTGSICGGKMDVFFSPTLPNNVLYLFGGGHVGKATASIAAEAGWRVEIFDERSGLVTRERHPKAAAFHSGDVLESARELEFGPQDYVILMTHTHERDFALLKEIIGKDAGYIGVIASRTKAVLFRKELAAAGYSSEAIEKIHMPIGLSIHAQTPEEIAIAIVAQMIEIRRTK